MENLARLENCVKRSRWAGFKVKKDDGVTSF